MYINIDNLFQMIRSFENEQQITSNFFENN